jgi:hypothetical protein
MELTCEQSGSILEASQAQARAKGQATNEFAACYPETRSNALDRTGLNGFPVSAGEFIRWLTGRHSTAHHDGLSHRSMERSQKWILHQSQRQ